MWGSSRRNTAPPMAPQPQPSSSSVRRDPPEEWDRPGFDEEVGLGWSRSFSFVGTIVIVGFLLVFLRSILVPFVAALFLAYLVRPLADRISACRCIPYFRRRHDAALLREENGEDQTEPLLGGDGAATERLEKASKVLVSRAESLLPRWVGVLLALFLALAVLIGILAAMVVTITSFQSQMPRYRTNAQLLWQRLLEWLKVVFNLDLSELQAVPSRIFSNAAGTFLTTSVTLTTDLMLVIVFLAFILVQPPAQQSSLRKKIDDSVSRYIILKSVISFSVAIFVYVVLAAVSFPLGLFVALATFVLNFIPSLGPAACSGPRPSSQGRAGPLPAPSGLWPSSHGRASPLPPAPGALAAPARRAAGWAAGARATQQPGRGPRRRRPPPPRSRSKATLRTPPPLAVQAAASARGPFGPPRSAVAPSCVQRRGPLTHAAQAPPSRRCSSCRSSCSTRSSPTSRPSRSACRCCSTCSSAPPHATRAPTTAPLSGNILEPWLFGQQFAMNPVIILFSLGVWYILWGTIGAVLAVPLTSVLRILCNHLIENNIGMPYIAAVSSLLEGRSLDLSLRRKRSDVEAAGVRENPEPSPGKAA